MNEAHLPPAPRVLIVGAGAVGSYLAVALDRAQVPVCLLARGQRAAAVAQDGVRLAMNGQDFHANVPVATHLADLPPADLAILAVKTGALPDALRALADAPALRAVLTLQNGVEAPAQAATALPGVQAIGGRMHGFFELHGDTVRHAGVAPSIALGPLAGDGAAAAGQFARLLARAGVETEQPADIRVALWEKMLLASSIGAVAAALGVPVGRLRETPEHWALLGAAMGEVAALAERLRIALPADCVARTLDFVATFPPAATSSLQRDLEAGRPSEFDALAGAVVRLAASAGLPVPTHEDIVQRLRQRGYL